MSIITESVFSEYILGFLSSEQLLGMKNMDELTSNYITNILLSRKDTNKVYITKYRGGYLVFPTNKNSRVTINWSGKDKPSDKLNGKFIGFLYQGVVYLK
jgi:hypothetical protein